MATVKDLRQNSQLARERITKARQMLDEAVKQRKIYKMRYAEFELKIQVLLDEVQRIKQEQGIM